MSGDMDEPAGIPPAYPLRGEDALDGPAPAAHPSFGLEHEDRLPWLESDDRFDDGRTVDSTRVAGAVAGGLALLALVVGGVWYGTHHHAGGTPVADGSTLAAPAGNVKEAPKDPGGKTFAGTGDSSFALSQGQSRPAQLAADATRSASDVAKGAGAIAASAALAAASAGADAVNAGKAPTASVGSRITAASDTATATHAPAQTVKPSINSAAAVDTGAGDGGLVQVGAYSTQASAEAGWVRLAGAHDALSGLRHRIVEGQADIGTVFRLQAITAPGGAGALCDKLRGINVACQVKR